MGLKQCSKHCLW